MRQQIVPTTKTIIAVRAISWWEESMRIPAMRPAVKASAREGVTAIPAQWLIPARQSALIVKRTNAFITAIINALQNMWIFPE